MDGAPALIDAIRTDCPRQGLRPLDSLSGAAERNAQMTLAGAVLVCSDALSCHCALSCRVAAEDMLERLWRQLN